MTNKMRSRPPGTVEEFIGGGSEANSGTTENTASSPTKPKDAATKRQKRFPWNEPSVREDVIKTYNLRLPEPYMLKLRYIAEHTPASMQKYCLSVLIPAIDKKLLEIEGE